MQRVLRKRARVSYCDYEEPDPDEYIFCSACEDYVYEYCSVHGPLLIVPDTRIPAAALLPRHMSRALLTLPHVFLRIACSSIPDAGLGVFTTRALPADVRFGPYTGHIVQEPTSDYCWQIYNADRSPRHLVDGGDGHASNWLRYVNCCRGWREQNLVAYQYRGEIYYRTVRVIPRDTELLVYYGSEFAKKLAIGPFASKRDVPEKKIQTPSPSTSSTQVTREDGDKKNVKVTPTNDENSLLSHVDLGDEKDIKTPAIVEKISRPQLITKAPISRDLNDQNLTQKNVLVTYSCEYCPSIFITADLLQRHSRLHDTTRSFQCDVCKFIFKTNAKLKQHMSTHTGEKPFKCTVCDFSCSRNDTLKRHLRTHTGEKPFKCTVCDFSFSQNGDLKRHLTTHTGEKPFKCNVCDFSCTQNSNLKIHLRTHTGEKPFKCSQCDFRSGYKNYLKSHEKKHAYI